MLKRFIKKKINIMKLILTIITVIFFLDLDAQNKGMQFRELDSNYVITPDNIAINFINNFSVEFWMKPNKTEMWAVLLQEGVCTAGTFSYHIGINPDSTLSFTFNCTGNCNNTKSYKCDTKLHPGVCLHVAVTYSSSGIKIYFNGVLQPGHYSIGSFCNNLEQTADPLRIGCYKYYNGSLGAWYDGMLDELRLWSKVLTPSEILSNYTDTLTGNETDLRLYYKFNENIQGPGMTIVNSAATGSALNGNTFSESATSPYPITPCFLYHNCNFHPLIVTDGSPTICQGEDVLLSSSSQASTHTYQWFLNSLPIAGQTGADFVATSSGSYSFVADSLGCVEASNVVNVVVNPLPTVTLNPLPTYIIYSAPGISMTGNPVGGIFSGVGVSGNIFNASIAGLGTHVVNYSFTNANNCTGTASSSTLVYDTTGIVCTTYLDTITTWTYDTAHIVVADTNYITITDTIHLSVTDTIYNIITDTIQLVITDTIYHTITDTIFTSVADTLVINAVLTGVAPPNNINILQIYPNPALTYIIIDNGNFSSMNGYTVRIDNDISQTVFTSLVNQQSFYIDLSTWTGNGLYFVYVIDDFGNIIVTRKIILQ